MCLGNWLGKTAPPSGKGEPVHRIAFVQGPGCTWWVMWEDGEIQCVPQEDLSLGEKSNPWFELCFIGSTTAETI